MKYNGINIINCAKSHGDYISFIHARTGERILGRISCYNNYSHLCTDNKTFDGAKCEDTFGNLYSWCLISKGDIKLITDFVIESSITGNIDKEKTNLNTINTNNLLLLL